MSAVTLLVKGRRDGRDIVTVTPTSAGWQYVGFSAHRLGAGERLALDLPGREICLVVLTGSVTGAIEFELRPGQPIPTPRLWRNERRRFWHDP